MLFSCLAFGIKTRRRLFFERRSLAAVLLDGFDVIEYELLRPGAVQNSGIRSVLTLTLLRKYSQRQPLRGRQFVYMIIAGIYPERKSDIRSTKPADFADLTADAFLLTERT